jgi:hypothetical protein
MAPSPRAHEEAGRHPNGHVFEVDGEFEPNGNLPHNRIKGAWKVNGEGRIVGKFIPNPYYRATTEPLDGWESWLE